VGKNVTLKRGVKEAIKMLQGLGSEQAKNLLELMRRKDPEMAELLEKHMVTMEDLQYLTESMLIHLLRDIDLENFGVALKTVDLKVSEKLLGMVSSRMREDIEFGMKGKPRKVSEVQAIQDKILQIVREKIDQGQIVIDPEGDKLV
jgi:flagellar motor switch protein FliG